MFLAVTPHCLGLSYIHNASAYSLMKLENKLSIFSGRIL
ncbi:hypothetical protein M2409_005222 [Sphingobacterium sp. JUb21]|nr:hypothetical protein [Sphingobacterium sp. JUb21]